MEKTVKTVMYDCFGTDSEDEEVEAVEMEAELKEICASFAKQREERVRRAPSNPTFENVMDYLTRIAMEDEERERQAELEVLEIKIEDSDDEEEMITAPCPWTNMGWKRHREEMKSRTPSPVPVVCPPAPKKRKMYGNVRIIY